MPDNIHEDDDWDDIDVRDEGQMEDLAAGIQQSEEDEVEEPTGTKDIVLRNANNYSVAVEVVVGTDSEGHAVTKKLNLPRKSESGSITVLNGYDIDLPGRVKMEELED